MAKVLIVDDEKDIRDLLGDILDDEGINSDAVGNAQAAIDHVDHKSYDLVILDIWLKESNMDGIDILKYIKNSQPDLPVVIISGHGNIEIAVAAVKQGAADFIEKPFNVDQLLVVVNRALELSKLRKIAKQNGKTDEQAHEMPFIGSSSIIKNLRSQLEKLGKAQSRVMFSGPSGSGKELAARYLHENSTRADYPFVVVNSALLTAKDVEQQLFGYEEDGGTVHIGLLERANHGTLFFDEISDMPLETQGKILRIINDQSFERLGNGRKISVDIRYFSASCEDLEERIEKGLFREELYHRLNVVTVALPSLRQHAEDIPELADHFIKLLSERENLSPKTISDDALELLQTLSWSGNVRELRNRIEHALIMSSNKKELTKDDFQTSKAANAEDELNPEYLFLPLREARELFEQRYLSSQIERYSGNISRTANFIGMERSALHRKLKSLNIGGQDRKNS